MSVLTVTTESEVAKEKRSCVSRPRLRVPLQVKKPPESTENLKHA